MLESLLNGDKAVYKKQKKKKNKHPKPFKTELSEDEDGKPKEWSDPSSKLHSDNDKSDYEYQSSEDSMMGVKDGPDSGLASSGDEDSITDDDSLSNVQAKKRRARKLKQMSDIQKQMHVLKKLKKQQKKIQEKNRRLAEEQGSKTDKTGTDLLSPTKGKIKKDPNMKGHDAEKAGLGFDPSKVKSGISEEIRLMKEKLKNIIPKEKKEKDKFQMNFKGGAEGSKSTEKSAMVVGDRLKNIRNIKLQPPNKAVLGKGSSSDSVDTEYLDRAALANAKIQTIKPKPGPYQLLKNTSSKLNSIDKLELDNSKGNSKTISKFASKAHSRNSSRDQSYLLDLPKDLVQDILSKKELLHKQPVKSNLMDTLRDHSVTRERQKQQWEEIMAKNNPLYYQTNGKTDQKPAKSIPTYEEMNQYTNTAAKVDSWNPARLSNLITLQHLKTEQQNEDTAQVETEITEYEKELFDPSKNFMDILDLMLSPESKAHIAQPALDLASKPDLHTIKELIMDRKKKQIQVGRT